jgi:hypothetical protein
VHNYIKIKFYMNLANKKYRDNKTGQMVRVIDSFENIAILENKEKIDTRRLLDINYYTEEIDPSAFFNTQNTYDSLFEKIKTIPTENLQDDSGEILPVIKIDGTYRPEGDDSAVIYSTIDDEKEELARKYGVNLRDNASISKQNEAFSKILGDAADDMPVFSNSEPEVQRVEVNRDFSNAMPVEPAESYENRTPVANANSEVDPIYTMFKGVKRSVEFNIDLKLENKIPRLDFIEMMEDSYEKSIIEFLAEEFTNELLKNPKMLKESISNKIREMVYKPKKALVTKRIVKEKAKPEIPKPISTAKRSRRKKETEL